ncbi:hypothetical protein APR41_05295 [Salegentibacter salinarum]|uniref:Outer membrane protein beta-barrel domain-containing protein n=1 Tax=Salegentibacter salinarum TaxID=447422 RepID=A0A2N0TSA9_9FLAO|nr:DUF6268 family outer membrane beta-barrel protein [Salegentibacter salinarum]PKD17627.1 hypothetical protein APR41_05295 [Salegentibacter salinarum]SKB49907.1 hypothetical protein SAMN05660903_01084 [Salegentibacter salinarum]
MLKRLVMMLILIKGTTFYSQIFENKIVANYTLVPSGEEMGSSRSNISYILGLNAGNFNINNKLGIGVNNLSYPMDASFNTTGLETFYRFHNYTAIGYRFSRYWKLEVDSDISLASNLKGELTSEKFLLNGGFAITRDFGTVELPAYVKFGLGYYTFLGVPKILPRVLFYKKFNKTLALGLGFPKTEITYQLDRNNSLQGNLEFKGMYANVHHSSRLTSSISNMVWSSNTTSLKFQHRIDNTWSFDLNLGYGFSDEYKFIDHLGNETYTINNESFFLGTGIILNLNNK